MANAANGNGFNDGAISTLNAEISHIKAQLDHDQSNNDRAKANQKNNANGKSNHNQNSSNANSTNGKNGNNSHNNSNGANGSNGNSGSNGLPGGYSLDGFNLPFGLDPNALNGGLIPGMNGYDPYGNINGYGYGSNGYPNGINGMNGSSNNPNAMNNDNSSDANDPQDQAIQEKQKKLQDLQNGQDNNSDDLNTFDHQNSNPSDDNASDNNAADPSDAYRSGYQAGKRKLHANAMKNKLAKRNGNGMNANIGTGKNASSTKGDTMSMLSDGTNASDNGMNNANGVTGLGMNTSGIDNNHINTESSNSGNGKTLPKTGDSNDAKVFGSIAMTLELLSLLGADPSRRRKYNE